MGKERARLACSGCGSPASAWSGRCPGCGAWGTISEVVQRGGGDAAPVPLLEGGSDEPLDRLRTGFPGMDRVLGGGLVPGSVVLVAGEPGIGKSTLLLQVLGSLTASGRECLLASGEESRPQVAARARRLGLAASAPSYVPGRELPDVIAAVTASRPQVLVVDSIQSVRDPEHQSLPGGPAQVRLCADRLVGLAKAEGIAVVVTGQVTKDGEMAGPRTLEHAVDTVCSFEGDSRMGFRLLSGGKNRFGPEGEVVWFEMHAGGLREADPALLVSEEREAGAAIALVAAGRRALAVEVQALSVRTEGPPRRHVTGLDPRRFQLVAAVVDRAAGLPVARAELFGAASGGLRIEDPGADLAVAASLASAVAGIPPPADAAFVGEVTLTGAVRPVGNLASRLGAAATAGVGTVFCAGGGSGPPGVRIVRVRRLADALSWALGKGRKRAAPGADPAPGLARREAVAIGQGP